MGQRKDTEALLDAAEGELKAAKTGPRGNPRKRDGRLRAATAGRKKGN